MGSTPELYHKATEDKAVPLKQLHRDLNDATLDHLRKQSTEDLIDSLRPGQEEGLKTRPDGTILQGNHRIKVLKERGR
jgi:hypothetical protein